MKIAIGSTRGPKIEAVKEAWQVFATKILSDSEEEVTFHSYDISNGTPHMPLSVTDLMEGARGRAENLALQLKKEKAEANFYIGLEGGFHVIDSQGPRRQAFLESWAYVSDGYMGFHGHGGGLYVPLPLPIRSSIAGSSWESSWIVSPAKRRWETSKGPGES